MVERHETSASLDVILTQIFACQRTYFILLNQCNTVRSWIDDATVASKSSLTLPLRRVCTYMQTCQPNAEVPPNVSWKTNLVQLVWISWSGNLADLLFLVKYWTALSQSASCFGFHYINHSWAFATSQSYSTGNPLKSKLGSIVRRQRFDPLGWWIVNYLLKTCWILLWSNWNTCRRWCSRTAQMFEWVGWRFKTAPSSISPSWIAVVCEQRDSTYPHPETAPTPMAFISKIPRMSSSWTAESEQVKKLNHQCGLWVLMFAKHPHQMFSRLDIRTAQELITVTGLIIWAKWTCTHPWWSRRWLYFHPDRVIAGDGARHSMWSWSRHQVRNHNMLL